MALAMDAAIRWLADFVRWRTDAWPDNGIRLRIVAISSAIVIMSMSTITDNVRQGLLSIQQIANALVALLFVSAAVGLCYRSKAAYIAAYVFTLTLSASLAFAAVWLPIFALLAQNVHAGEPIPPLTIVDAFSLIFVSFLIFVAFRFLEVRDALRRIGTLLDSAIAGFVIVGWIFLTAWSVVDMVVGSSFVQTWLANPDYLASLRVGLIAFLALPMFGYCLWSYTTLRSRAVRDAFYLL